MISFISVGNSKTGTTSPLEAIALLGKKVLGWKQHCVQLYLDDQIDELLQIAGRYDFLKDWPWSHLYEELDRRFDCRLILTTRDEAEWALSYINHLRTSPESAGAIHRAARQLGNGFNPLPHLDRPESLVEGIFRPHQRGVRSYFRWRPGKLLEINLFEDPDPWKTLSAFTGIPPS